MIRNRQIAMLEDRKTKTLIFKWISSEILGGEREKKKKQNYEKCLKWKFLLFVIRPPVDSIECAHVRTHTHTLQL